MVALNIASMFYLSFFLCLVLGLLEDTSGSAFRRALLRRWGKLLGGLVAIGLLVQILTWIGG